MQVYELKRGGTEISVTKINCVEYIHLMAHYRLNVQLHRQFQAFRAGLQSVIPSHWLSLFSQQELQVLVSGAQVPINLHDLRLNTTYSGRHTVQSMELLELLLLCSLITVHKVVSNQ